MGNGACLSISHIGHSIFHSPISSRPLTLTNLLHVPVITKNLLSVSTFARDNHVYFEFHPHFCLVKDQVTQAVLLRGVLHDGLYKFDLGTPLSSPTTKATCLNASASSSGSSSSQQSNKVSTDMLHQLHNRLCHPSPSIVKQVFSICNFSIPKNEVFTFCSACVFGKTHRLPFPLSQSTVSAPLQLIYSDVWGPSNTPSRNGFRFYASFIDAFSRFTWIYFLKYKSDFFKAFMHFKTHVENQLDHKIKIIQTDGGGEFQALTSFLQTHGIIHRLSCAHTSQQNGVVEIKHRHIVDMGLSLLAHASMPLSFWDEAFSTAVPHQSFAHSGSSRCNSYAYMAKIQILVSFELWMLVFSLPSHISQT